MHTRLSEGSLRRVAVSMIDEFGADAELEVETRIARAASQDLSAIADSWRTVKQLVLELRQDGHGKSRQRRT
jgi:hypothetical protein